MTMLTTEHILWPRLAALLDINKPKTNNTLDMSLQSTLSVQIKLSRSTIHCARVTDT